MSQFHAGDISMRKLRVLSEHLPRNSPAFWHLHEDQQYGLQEHLLWLLLWSQWEIQVLLAQLGGNKKAKMPQDKPPRYPWSEIKNANSSKFGDLGDHTPEEALAYLMSLEG